MNAWHTVSTGGSCTADVALIHGSHVAVSTPEGVGLYTVDGWDGNTADEDDGAPLVWSEGARNRDDHLAVWESWLAYGDQGDAPDATPAVLVCGECSRGNYFPETLHVAGFVGPGAHAVCDTCGHRVHESDIRAAMDAGRLYWTAPLAHLSLDDMARCMMCPATGTGAEIDAHTRDAHDDDGDPIDPSSDPAARMVLALYRAGALSPAALDMVPAEALWQWREVNALDASDAAGEILDALRITGVTL